jgi:hypothetical protein
MTVARTPKWISELHSIQEGESIEIRHRRPDISKWRRMLDTPMAVSTAVGVCTLETEFLPTPVNP